MVDVNLGTMPLTRSFNNLTNNAAQMTPALVSGIDTILFKSLQIRGEFPTSLNLLNSIQSALKDSSTTIQDLADMICVDHVLALRMISIANYEFYSKGKSPLSVSEALEQLTLPKVEDVILNLAEAKNFNAIYLGRAVSLTMMQQAILASLLARGILRIAGRNQNLEEQAYVTAVLSNTGPLLLAFYRPDLYSALCLDCMDNHALFERIFRKVMRKSIGEFAAAVARTLSLPPIYQDLCLRLDNPLDQKPSVQKESGQAGIMHAVYMANALAHEICYSTGIQGVQSLLCSFDTGSLLDISDLEDLIGIVPDIYLEHCRTLAIKPVRLPEYLLWFAPVTVGSQPVRWRLALPGINERINPFLYELRSCFKTTAAVGQFSALPQTVYCTLSALIKGLNFDRAILFKVDDEGRFLFPLLCHGVKLFNPEKMRRFIADPDSEVMPDVKAYLEQQTVFSGEPVFSDGWPFVAFPVASGGRVLGVFYADKIRRPDSDALDSQEQISCVALAEEWHDVPHGFR